MIVMNKYCKSKWDRTRPAYVIRSKKYKRLEELQKLQESDSTESKKK